MTIDVTLGDAVFKCDKCGATRKCKVKAPGYYKGYGVEELLNKKMIHVCNKSENKYGIMTIVDVTLGEDCDMNRILDNAYLSIIPIKENKDSRVKFDEV